MHSAEDRYLRMRVKSAVYGVYFRHIDYSDFLHAMNYVFAFWFEIAMIFSYFYILVHNLVWF